MINIIPISAFKDNYIWTLHDGQYAAVVDPGDAEPVLAWLNANNIKLAAILCTHHHNDHVGGICELVEVYNVPVYGPQLEIIPCCSHPVSEGDKVTITELGIQLNVLDIPGHTSGHVAYLTSEKIEKSHSLFCGDTLFGCGCGRLFEGTASQLHNSLQRLAHLPDDTRVYCAHEYTEANIRFALACEPGNLLLKQREIEARTTRSSDQPTLPSTIRLENATNPFLRCNVPEIRNTLHQRGLRDNTDLGVFTALREWKNHF